MAHTPGKWSVYSTPNSPNIADVIGEDRQLIATCWSESARGVKAKPNADLISAAPDLQEVVRRALACGALNGPHLREAAEAALAKARGVTSKEVVSGA